METKITIGGREMSVNEAMELWEELNKIFSKPDVIKYPIMPKYLPWEPSPWDNQPYYGNQ